MNFNMQKLMNFNTIVDDTNGARRILILRSDSQASSGSCFRFL